jgi:Family of unknown function (DUF6069)
MAGVVGAGIVVVGFIVTRGILDVPVLVEREGKLVNANVWWYALGAFAAALVATGLLHLLLLGAPRPFTFYGWITGLAVAIAALVPFTTGAKLDTKVALCAINLAAGVVIAAIVATIGRSALSRPDALPYGSAGPPPYDPGGPLYDAGGPPYDSGRPPYNYDGSPYQPDPYQPQGRPTDEYRERPGNWWPAGMAWVVSTGVDRSSPLRGDAAVLRLGHARAHADLAIRLAARIPTVAPLTC